MFITVPSDHPVMVETPRDPPEDLDEELEEFEEDLDEMDAEIRSLIDAIREETDIALRLGVRYAGDDVDLLFVREDVREHYTPPELEQRVETLVMKGLGDPPREESLFDFGTLDATIRWYDEALVAHFPYREWSGLVFTFDRRASPLVDLAKEFLGGQGTGE